MLEVMIIVCLVIAAFCAGNVIGWSSGKEHGKASANFEMLFNNQRQQAHFDKVRERLLNDLSRQALAFSQKQKHWIKVYDAEVVE